MNNNVSADYMSRLRVQQTVC